MFRVLLILCILIGSMTDCISQSKQDYLWLFGNDQSSDPGVQAFQFDFNDNPLSIEIREGGLQFDQQNVSICTPEGKLLFYSNGCAIANADHEVMPNGDSINASNFYFERWTSDCSRGIPAQQNNLILQDPKNPNGYYILHKPTEYNPTTSPSLFIERMWYSYVDMSLDNGRGDVVLKNELLYEGDLLSSYLTGIYHSNQRDWWIIQPQNKPDAFAIYQLDTAGFSLKKRQLVERSLDDRYSSAAGEAKFSPDGTKYAYYNIVDGLHLYDFDRTTGQLSNFRYLDRYYGGENDLRFSAVEFSPDSRFLYLASWDTLWQVDTWVPDLADGELLIDVYDGRRDPFPTTFFASALGPDCRIYICPGSSTNVFHVINKPNELGKACDFVQGGIQLPIISGRSAFPNHPRFRVDEEEKCDPDILSILGETVYYRRDLTAYPNPARGPVTVELPEGVSGSLHVLDIQGREIGSVTTIDGYQQSVILNTDYWPAGTYSVEFIPDDLTERLIYTAWVVRQ